VQRDDGGSVQNIDFTKAEALMPALVAAHAAENEVIPRLAEARRIYAKSRSDEDWDVLNRIQREASEKHEATLLALRNVEEATGLPEEFFEELAKPEVRSDPVDRTPRSLLTDEKIASTADIDDALPQALDALLKRLPLGWLDEEPAELFRLPIGELDRPVSIVKGVRPEGERPPGHRLRQAIRAAQDFLAKDARYDHFAGAMLVPQLAHLGLRLADLTGVPRAEERISNLWRKPAEVDSTALELLVAGALAERGREPEFIPEAQEKTPDIRCHDPFPLVVECKRRDALSVYEQDEERTMRTLFTRLEQEARKFGLFGLFELRLTIEAGALDIEEVAAKCLLQRFPAHPERPLSYPWGSVAYRERPMRFDLPSPTKAYSPEMLEFAFGWNADLPEWDGIICKTLAPEGVIVDEVRAGIAIAWTNLNATAVAKRSRPPTSLFGSATNQMPGGEFGIIYLAYNEGAREEIADLRVEELKKRLQEWEHSAAFRIPVTFLIRLLPRALGEGRPDLIENVIQFYSEAGGGDAWFFEAYPSGVFAPRH